MVAGVCERMALHGRAREGREGRGKGERRGGERREKRWEEGEREKERRGGGKERRGNIKPAQGPSQTTPTCPWGEGTGELCLGD